MFKYNILYITRNSKTTRILVKNIIQDPNIASVTPTAEKKQKTTLLKNNITIPIEPNEASEHRKLVRTHRDKHEYNKDNLHRTISHRTYTGFIKSH